MKLYSYQENALLAIDSDPSNSQLISMPTGTGKTITFLSCAMRKNKKCLILVHRNELLQQTYEKAKIVGYRDDEISLITSDEKQPSRRLTIAMVPTLIRNLSLYSPDDIQMMIIDEAHHATALSYRKILDYFRVVEDKKLLLGFTATPLRGDKACLGSIFQSHSFKMTLSEATQNGYICPVHGMRVDIHRSLEGIEMQGGDYNPQQLDRIMNCESINKLIADKCENLSRLPALIFTTSIDHAEKIESLLKAKGKKAASVSYKTAPKDLEKILSDLKKGEIDFISNAVKLSEGFDYPPIQTIILARPTRSPVLYKQMIGRGLRNFPGKHECFVLEFSGNDPKMICWEDIDENCTFQSSTLEEKRNRDDAIKTYKAKFVNPNVKILDVRISPFKFYECKIRRMFSYKKHFRSIPFSEGFCVFEYRRTKKFKSDAYGFDNYGWMCFWKEQYKSFTIWSGGVLWQSELGWLFPELDKQCHYFAECNGNLSRWYPSEEEPITNKQKTYLKNPLNISSRKAEMFIEEAAIKEAIQKYWEGKVMPEFDDDEYDSSVSIDEKASWEQIQKTSLKREIMTLSGKY